MGFIEKLKQMLGGAGDSPREARRAAGSPPDPEPVVAPGSVAPSEDLGHPDSLAPKDQATPSQ